MNPKHWSLFVIHFRYGVSDHVLTHKLVQYASQIPPSFDPIAPRKYSSSTWICGRKQLDYELEISWGRTQSQLSHIEIKTPPASEYFSAILLFVCLVFSDDESNGKRVLSTNAYHKFLWQPIGNKVIILCYYKLHTNTNLLSIHSEKCSNNIWNPSSVNFQNLVVPAFFQHIDWV